jgi:hypothetical protein
LYNILIEIEVPIKLIRVVKYVQKKHIVKST